MATKVATSLVTISSSSFSTSFFRNSLVFHKKFPCYWLGRPRVCQMAFDNMWINLFLNQNRVPVLIIQILFQFSMSDENTWLDFRKYVSRWLKHDVFVPDVPLHYWFLEYELGINSNVQFIELFFKLTRILCSLVSCFTRKFTQFSPAMFAPVSVNARAPSPN